jgi:mono/diheme cytochrome c family protein
MTMKKLFIIAFLMTGAVIIISCNDIKRKPSNVYMPDMAYSRAYETYAERDSDLFTTDTLERGIKIFYNNRPVTGTIARNEEMPFPLSKDAQGDSTNYVASRQVKNPIDSLPKKELVEAERLYLINCGICHGTKLDGNGPLYKGGEGPFPAKPATLVGDAKYEAMPDGMMYYSATYGKNLMGSYASQLSRRQRWEVIYYIKSKQKEAKASAVPATTATAKN